MKVLWLVNAIFPYPESKLGKEKNHFGGWLTSLHEKIVAESELKMAVVTTYKGEIFHKFADEKTVYYLIPTSNPSKYQSDTSKYWHIILEEFKPDVIHIHGTEYPRGLELLDIKEDIPVITSIQGLCKSVEEVYYGNIPHRDLIKNISLRDILKLNTVFSSQKDFAKRSVYERKIILKSDYIIGRTLWDKANILSISPNKKYFSLNEILREPFYENKTWDINNIERYSLFCSQATYPIKGLHILLKSMSLLKNEYPNIKLYISGTNIIDESTIKNKIKTTGYGKYIKNLLKKYNLQNNVIFTGMLSASLVRDKLIKTHIYISPSFIENESNSLSEAAILGVPCIGSYVGGVTERIENQKTGFLYPPTEYAMLAYYIKEIFDHDDLAVMLGNNARLKMQQIVSPQNNLEKLLKIYDEVVNSKKGK